MGVGQETPIFRAEGTAPHYDWGWWVLAILAGVLLLKRI